VEDEDNDKSQYQSFIQQLKSKTMKRLFCLTLISATMLSIYAQDRKVDINPLAIEYNDLATKQILVQNYDSALVLINKALSLDGNYTIGYSNKVGIYVGLKDFKKALIAADKLIEIDPHYADGYGMAGGICDVMGDTKMAFDYYKRGISCYDEKILKTNDPKQLITNRAYRACLLRLIGKEDEGKKELEKLKAENPDNFAFDQLLKLDRQTYLKSLPK